LIELKLYLERDIAKHLYLAVFLEKPVEPFQGRALVEKLGLSITNRVTLLRFQLFNEILQASSGALGLV